MKTFEKFIEKEKLINKKYVLWIDSENEIFEILEMTHLTYDPDIRYWSKTIYTYNSLTYTLEPYYNAGEQYFADKDKEYVILQSDNVEELKNELKLIISSNKYNL